MSHLSTDFEVLDDELTKILKPKLIADGYYADLINAIDNMHIDVRKVHAVMAVVRQMHEHHAPGPMSLCEEICRRVDAL